MKTKPYISKELHAAIKAAGTIGFVKYDGRRKMFKDSKITKDEFDYLSEKSMYVSYARCTARFCRDKLSYRVPRIREIIDTFDKIPYHDDFVKLYGNQILDDWEMYQRPSSNGKVYVAICPGETGNNIVVDDPVAVAILARKYREHYGL